MSTAKRTKTGQFVSPGATVTSGEPVAETPAQTPVTPVQTPVTPVQVTVPTPVVETAPVETVGQSKPDAQGVAALAAAMISVDEEATEDEILLYAKLKKEKKTLESRLSVIDGQLPGLLTKIVGDDLVLINNNGHNGKTKTRKVRTANRLPRGEVKNRIFEILKKSKEPVRAGDIAAKLNMEYSNVVSSLNAAKTEFKRASRGYWTLVTPVK